MTVDAVELEIGMDEDGVAVGPLELEVGLGGTELDRLSCVGIVLRTDDGSSVLPILPDIYL